ncbi:RHS repeat-associated core domain-containing protein [Pseudomonas sp. SWRI59]|uniref:RHS repeat domain-containing protein n=1 Tax=unclassified Pseudomonas TaxID=196821 RepID=UPI00164412A2|nr:MULTISPECIES: RHS repeat-associated core domain-containing protein [unclassified Pseudomonas]MBC3502958.1 RHS repeat-associated core domain-containing protein [Pseudomonas sp. SWRI59]MBC3509239.1 RHS repeat-associated core domain-containing protein [Pseudomonas sp. SWRI68]
MSTKTTTSSQSTAPMAPVLRAATETTRFTYDPLCAMLTKTETDDGWTSHFCYYPVTASNDKPDRSDKVPTVRSVLQGLKLEEGTGIVSTLGLACPNLPDPSSPPLMGHCSYVKFPDGTLSDMTLTLYGYQSAGIDSKGMLVPDTILTIEGVTVDTGGTPWTVGKASDRVGVVVSLQQLMTTVIDGQSRAQTTWTRWYKDNTARQTRKVTQVTDVDAAAGTVASKSATPLQYGNLNLTATLSHQIRSARSGRVLRETEQDDLGRPATMLYYRYDARDRSVASSTYGWDETGFMAGEVSEAPLATLSVEWSETSNGTSVRTVGPDGRSGRTFFDGLQRPVRRELQRLAGDDHCASNYVCLEEIAYGADGEVQHQCVFDYLPGGLCLRNEGASLPDNLQGWFWQSETRTLTRDADESEILTTEVLTGNLSKGVLHGQHTTQHNHNDGQVSITQLLKRRRDTSAHLSSTGRTHVDKHNARGQRIESTETVIIDNAEVARKWAYAYDELGRRIQITTPDNTVLKWTYQGLSETPVSVSLKPQKGTEQQLGHQTLLGSSHHSGEIASRTVGGPTSSLTYSQEGARYKRPDGTRLWSEPNEDGDAQCWYTDRAGKDVSVPKTLVASFAYNDITRTLYTERPEAAEQVQSRVLSDCTLPLLMGAVQSNRWVRGGHQQQCYQQSLRGDVSAIRHANGMSTRAWQDGWNRRSRVRRGRLEYRYRYGTLGEIEQLTVQDLRSGRGMTVSMAYDDLSRETQRTYRLDGVIKSRYVQSWSLSGQLLSKTWYRNAEQTATRTETYTYHSLRNELECWCVEAKEGYAIEDAHARSLKQQRYSYDALGNLVSCTTTFSDNKTETRSYKYTDASQPTRRTHATVTQADASEEQAVLSCDANGNLSENALGQTLTYTQSGQLRSVSAAGSTLATYEYDELGRLAAQWDETGKQRRVLQYSDHQLCGEVWLDAEGSVLRRRLLDEEAGLVVDCISAESAREVLQTYFVLADPQSGGAEEYSISAEGKWQSRSIGFTPWGEAPLARLNTFNSGTAYNGQRVDPVTGSYHLGNGYRVYDPRHQAFYQSDSLSPFGEGGLNDRAYCAGRDPVNWHDPSGHIMISRRDQAESLASLDEMIRDTTPPHHDSAAWWEWALLGVATAFAVMGAIATGGMLGVLFLFIAGVSFGLTVGELVLRKSNPALSEKLGWAALATSLFDASGKGLAKVGRQVTTGARYGVQAIRGLRQSVKLHGLKSLFKASRRSAYLVKNTRAAEMLEEATHLGGIELGGSMKSARVISQKPDIIPGVGFFEDLADVKPAITKNATAMMEFIEQEDKTLKAARVKKFESSVVDSYQAALKDVEKSHKNFLKLRDESVILKRNFNTVLDKEYRTVQAARDELDAMLAGQVTVQGNRIDTIAVNRVTPDNVDEFSNQLHELRYKFSDESVYLGATSIIDKALLKKAPQSGAAGVSHWQEVAKDISKQLQARAAALEITHSAEITKIKAINKKIGDAFVVYEKTTLPALRKAHSACKKALNTFIKKKQLSGLVLQPVPEYVRPKLRANFLAHGYAAEGAGAALVRYEPTGRAGHYKPVRTSPEKFYKLLGEDLQKRMKNTPGELKKLTRKRWGEISAVEWSHLSMKRYDCARLLSCNLGLEFNGRSFAQGFSDVTRKPVKASVSRLFISTPDNSTLFKRFKKLGFKGSFNDYFRTFVAAPNSGFAISKQPNMEGFYKTDWGIQYNMKHFFPT